MRAVHYYFILLFTIGVTIGNICNGQTISIKVKDNEKKPLTGAVVQLKNLADSAIATKATDETGVVKFDGISNNIYKIKISFMGYQTLEKTIAVKPEHQRFEFQLKEDLISLGEVTVSAPKPLIRQEDDKMIIDPEPMASISSNTLEVLESTPGLFVDQDGGIYLNSATPAKVYINGREQKMSNQDISTILRSLPPGSVQRIEVMRTPSTKYDAASSGGIINVILKKGVKLGRFGSANMGMNQGFYSSQFAGLSFNTSGDKSTAYLNANYNHNDMLEELNATRTLKPDTVLKQTSHTRPQSHQVYAGYGLNYDANEKLNISYDGRINANFQQSKTANNNLIESSEAIKLFESNNKTSTNVDFMSIQQDFGLTRKYDTAGSEWDTKISYNFNNNSSSQNFNSDYIFPFSAVSEGKGNNAQNRHFGIFQSDLTYFLPLEFKVETGIKSAFQYYTSKADYFKNQNDTWINDIQRTNAFNYKENINAAYLQASRKLFFNFQLKAGLRMEHTYMKGHQTVPLDTNFLINRVDWFPYLYLSRRVIRIMGIELYGYLIYRKTINRPDYQNLNPYSKYIDQFLYEIGNPALKPQFTENIEMNISFDDMPVFAIGQNRTTDIFSSVVYQDKNQTGVAVRTYDNLGKNKEIYLRGLAGIPPGGRYFFAIGGQYNLNEYDGFYESQPLKFSSGSWRFFTFHALKLFGETRLTMNGFFMYKGQYNFYELSNFGQLNFGLRQTLLDKKLTITLSARDVLHTMATRFSINQGSINTSGDRYSDNQRFGINIRYNFGVSKKEDRKGFMPNETEEQ